MSLWISIFIIVQVVLMIVGSVWMLMATSRTAPGEKVGAVAKDHVWDEDLQELNNPLPRWWLILFLVTIIFSIGYLVLYPGFGSYSGTLGWSQIEQYEEEMAEAETRLAALYDQFADRSVTELAADGEAVRVGAGLYAQHCAACHGSDARGARGFPNLTDDQWLWGDSDDAILASIINGRQAAMPAWGAALGERGVTETVVYVQHLAGGKADPTLVAAGKQRYDMLCVACHGAEGKGNQLLGAPDLTNGIWLYGGDLDALRISIAEGRNGAMPAFGELLGEDRSRVLAAYVRSLSD